MEFTVRQLADLIEVCSIIGDASKIISGVSSFEEATETEITFAMDARFLNRLDESSAGAILIPADFSPVPPNPDTCTFIQVENPKISFFRLVHSFYPEKKIQAHISSRASLGSHVRIGKDAIIEPGVFIGDDVVIGDGVRLMPGVYVGDQSVIGDQSILKPNVTVMERSEIGKNVIIHSGSVIGSDGYGFAQNEDRHEKLVHTGYVSIGDDSEIGACNTIDRGTLGVTRIGQGVKTDNQVHIAHNVSIGDHSLLVAQVGIAGSTKIGHHVIIAGKAGITGHITIGNNTIIGPYAGVASSVGDNQIVSGIPQMPHRTWLKLGSLLPRLPQLRKMVLSIEKRLKKLEEKENLSENK